MARTLDRPGPAPAGDLYLGLVVLPEPGRLASAIESLTGFSGIEIAAPANHRIPAFAQVPVGRDEALLEEIRRLPDVLGVDVAFAQFVPEA